MPEPAVELVLRHAQPTIPPRVDYSLTNRGHELAAHLQPLLEWIAEYADQIVSDAVGRD